MNQASKPHSRPSIGYEFMRDQHGVCAVASPDGKRLCIMDAEHEGRHGWEASDQHSGADVALIRKSLISMQNMPEALHEFDRLVEQLEVLRNFAEACSEIIERSYNPIGEITARLDDVRGIAYPASEPEELKC